MAKVKSENAVEPVGLMEVFTVGEDGRLHCVTCQYDTQLSEKARRHAVAVHQVVLRPVQTIIKKRGVIPETLITEFVEQIVPASPEGA